MGFLIVCSWHTECGSCGYGSGGWAGSPALEGKPILGPDSETCPGCETTFDAVEDEYGRPYGEAADSCKE